MGQFVFDFCVNKNFGLPINYKCCCGVVQRKQVNFNFGDTCVTITLKPWARKAIVEQKQIFYRSSLLILTNSSFRDQLP